MHLKIAFLGIIILYLSNTGFSQEKEKAVTLNGYISSMQSATFNSISGPFINENLLHNRLNFRGFINDKITVAADFRNRLFTGDMVRMGKPYSIIIGNDRGVVDMSWDLIEKQSFLLNTTVDRLWLDLHYNKFQVTIGRQRINWGQTLVWNPNDIFNAYSFFDFDYAERPGSDAVRLQVFPTSSSAVELALKVNADDKVTVAGLYRFNKWGYDIQFLGGVADGKDIVMGAGWSGAIGGLSFRGEASWFDNYEDFPGNRGTLLATSGIDKIFKDNSMFQLQIMYCNNPLKLNDFNNFYMGTLSSKDLAFSRFSAYGQFTWATSPLLNLTLSSMLFPDLNGYFAGPSLDYSLSGNLDFSLIWQHFNALISGGKQNINLVFLRLKYSY